jgi:hypothetical protein
VEPLLAFVAALVALRLTGLLLRRWRKRRRPELAAWSAALAAFAVASAALAWGAAAGWSSPAFRVYYLGGALLTAPLLGAGSLLLVGRRWAGPLALLYAGVATGLAVAMPVEGAFAGTEIPDTSAHLELAPVRLVAIGGNSVGTLAVVAVALATWRRRPLGNALVIAGVLVAAAGSTLFGVGVAQSAVSLALAALLLYGGFVLPRFARPAAAAQPEAHADGRQHRDRDELDDQADGSTVPDHEHKRH